MSITNKFLGIFGYEYSNTGCIIIEDSFWDRNKWWMWRIGSFPLCFGVVYLIITALIK